MATRARLAQLPPELFENVAQYVPKHDLLALRLASKTCAAKAYSTFLPAFFSEVNVLACYKESIESAIVTAQHEEYGKKIHTLVIDIREFFSYYDDMWVDDGRARNGGRTDPIFGDEKNEMMCPKTIAMLRRQMEEPGLAVKQRLFNELLVVLKQRGHLKHVKIVDHDTDTTTGAKKKLGNITSLLTWYHMKLNDQLNYTLSGLADNEVALESFTMDCTHWAIPAHFAITSPLFMNSATAVFQNLKKISLSFWNNWRNPNKVIAGSVINTLPSTLESIELYVHSYPDSPFSYSHEIDTYSLLENLSHRTFPKLRHLTIHTGDQWMLDWVLNRFIRRHQTLEGLWFKGNIEKHVYSWFREKGIVYKGGNVAAHSWALKVPDWDPPEPLDDWYTQDWTIT